MEPIVVATHNIMLGLGLPALLRHYHALRAAVGLDVLCLQEAAPCHADSSPPRPPILDALGPEYAIIEDPDPGVAVAIVHHRERLRCLEHFTVELPRRQSLGRFERFYVTGDGERKHAQVAVFEEAQGGAPFAVANFHLDVSGDNHHRRSQVEAVVRALDARGFGNRLVACGDTNAFTLRRREHPGVLEHVLRPLHALRADHGVEHDGPTHFFARLGEPFFSHRLGRRIARLGFDLPLRRDVICTNLAVEARGQAETPESDHDLVWARLRLDS